MSEKVYIDILTNALRELADEAFQRDVWTNKNNPKQLVASFAEAVINVFDDAIVMHALGTGEVIYDSQVTAALWELHEATDAVDEYQLEEEIVDNPLMQIVREKAARTLALIAASDGKESTVRLVNAGEE